MREAGSAVAGLRACVPECVSGVCVNFFASTSSEAAPRPLLATATHTPACRAAASLSLRQFHSCRFQGNWATSGAAAQRVAPANSALFPPSSERPAEPTGAGGAIPLRVRSTCCGPGGRARRTRPPHSPVGPTTLGGARRRVRRRQPLVSGVRDGLAACRVLVSNSDAHSRRQPRADGRAPARGWHEWRAANNIGGPADPQGRCCGVPLGR